MTAQSGYDTSFSAIADYRYDVGLTNDEFEFTSGYRPEEMWTWNQWMNYFLYDDIPITEKQIKDTLEHNQKKIQINGNFEVMSKLPFCSKMKKLIELANYGKPYDNYTTLLVPINDHFDDYLKFSSIDPILRKQQMVQTVRYHILPFVIKPWELENRKMRLLTDLGQQRVISDWTQQTKYLVNPLNNDQWSVNTNVWGKNENPNYRNVGIIPKPIPRGENYSITNSYGYSNFGSFAPEDSDYVKILDYIETATGYIYIISRPLIANDMI